MCPFPSAVQKAGFETHLPLGQFQVIGFKECFFSSFGTCFFLGFEHRGKA